MDNKKIGKLIAKLRKEKDLTQQELGDKVGVGSRAVSKWECGITVPDISIINELSNILGISPKELLAGKLNKKENSTSKSKLKTKHKILILTIVIIFISIISLFIYQNNKTYIYNIVAVDHQKFQIDGYATYDKGDLSLYINHLTINDQKLIHLQMKKYEYDITIDDKLIFGYGKTKDDSQIPRVFTFSDFTEEFKINYIGKTKLHPKELLGKSINIILKIWDIEDNENTYDIEISLYQNQQK